MRLVLSAVIGLALVCSAGSAFAGDRHGELMGGPGYDHHEAYRYERAPDRYGPSDDERRYVEAPRYDDRFERSRGYDIPTYGYAAQNYGRPGAACNSGCGGYRPSPCGCGELNYAGGSVAVPSSFFYDTGGVGGYSDSGYGYGGGGYVVSGGGGYANSSASSRAKASAYSSSNVNIRVGGGRGGHQGGGGGCKGGCGGGGGGGGKH